MAVRPASNSSTAVAKPRRRTSASSAVNSATAVTVRSVKRQRRHQARRELVLGQVGQQDLAVRGRVQRDAPPGPVVWRQRGRPRRLVQVERIASGQDGQVDGLARLLGQRPADRAALLDHVEPRAGRPGQPHDAHPEPELAPRRVLGHQLTPVQRGQQPGRGRLVHVELARHLGDPGLAVPGQDLQDRHRPVHRLHRRRLSCPGPIVAHSATILAVNRSPPASGQDRGWRVPLSGTQISTILASLTDDAVLLRIAR